jgi:hypothetical protein
MTNLIIPICRRSTQCDSGDFLRFSAYDLSGGCNICGVPYKLVGNLPVRNITKTDYFISYQYDCIISEAFYSFLINEGIKFDAPLQNIVNTKNEKLPYFHLAPGISLPPLSIDKSGGIVAQEGDGLTDGCLCTVCKRSGYYDRANVPLTYVYESLSKDLLETSDVFFTWEFFGNSRIPPLPPVRIPGLAKQKIIITEKMKAAFEKYKITKMDYFNVEVINWV